MRSVRIGVHVHAEPERLRATLASLRANTEDRLDLVLLPDGPDPPTRAALAAMADLPQLGTDRPLGPPACFNRLAAGGDAELLVLLESGALVGPGWLERMLEALAVDPGHGLAGPSTNRSWNEQGAFPRAGGAAQEVARTARLALERFGAGPTWRTLGPLYSLADFCYLVRREVVDAIGLADEGYGLGPCWEMDYNVRAARAGFKGVWAARSYVYRSPPTERRRRTEAERFEASKHRYQDSFCALRLRAGGGSAAPPYQPHCRGDACEHFAPAGLIRLQLAPAPSARSNEAAPRPELDASTLLAAHRAAPSASPGPLGEGQGTSAVAPQRYPTPSVWKHPAPPPAASTTPDAPPARRAGPAVEAAAPPGQPLISCIMPTRGRPELAARAIDYFLRQDYPNRELIVVDDAGSDLLGRLPGAEQSGARIRYLQVPAGTRIGAKRNRACEVAAGAIVAHWDDDDWHGPRRLGEQAAPLLAGEADLVGLEAGIVFDLARWRFWRLTPELHRRLFVGDVHGGTLVYRREVWERLARYPDVSLAEDAAFLREATRRGARLRKLANDGLYVYLRHGQNAWSFTSGQYLEAGGWLPAEEPALPAEDRAFYLAQARRLGPAAQTPAPAARPLVSCIMPTYNRPAYVAQAIRYFLRQDYPNRELIVLDDGDQRAANLIPPDPSIRYVELPRRMVLGAKRNLACELARGEIIAHWDDDDWMSRDRLSRQVELLRTSGADLCGAARQLYYEPGRDRAWLYEYPIAHRRWMAGNTLCYRKSLWQRNRFAEIQVGEDTRFVWSALARNAALMPDGDFYVGLVHDSNTSPKSLSGPCWRPHPIAEVHRLLGQDLPFYRPAALVGAEIPPSGQSVPR